MYQLMYQFDSSGFAEDWMGKCIQILKLKWNGICTVFSPSWWIPWNRKCIL